MICSCSPQHADEALTGQKEDAAGDQRRQGAGPARGELLPERGKEEGQDQKNDSPHRGQPNRLSAGSDSSAKGEKAESEHAQEPGHAPVPPGDSFYQVALQDQGEKDQTGHRGQAHYGKDSAGQKDPA